MTKNDLIFWLCFVLIILVLIAIVNIVLILIFSALNTWVKRENNQYYFTIKQSKWHAAAEGEKPKVYYHEKCANFDQAYAKYMIYFLKDWWKWWIDYGIIIFF